MIRKLDFRSGIPIYSQIVDQIKHLIATGELSPGDQLPTVRQLAADLRVNFNTIARAYRILDEDGVISTQHGRGTYILEPATPVEAEHLREQSLEALTLHYLAEAERQGYSLEEVTKVIQRYLSERKVGVNL